MAEAKTKTTTLPAVNEEQNPPVQRIVIPEISADYKRVMLTHLNWRITDKLQKAYPGSTWIWCSQSPDEIAVKGGAARIRTYGTEEYNFADVSFDKSGQIKIAMVAVKTLKNAIPDQPVSTSGKADPDAIDPREWYELACAGKLKEIIDTISPHGFTSLYIQEDGSVMIQEGGEQKQIHRFQGFPTRKLWSELIQYLGADSISATETDQYLVLCWTI